jgi:hypothetical protein
VAGIPAIMTGVKDQAKAAAETFQVAGDRLTLLTDGPARLAALVALIDGAPHRRPNRCSRAAAGWPVTTMRWRRSSR